MSKRFTLLAAFFIAAFAGTALADAANICIVFSTQGPDLYADGTPALEGERYALCWSKNAEFGGIDSDGNAIQKGDRVLIFAPLATGGENSHCPRIFFQVDSADAPTEAGYYSVYLLDTRTASGSLAGDNAATGAPAVINGISLAVAGVSAAAGSSQVTLGASVTDSDAFAESAVPAAAGNPVITDFNPDGANGYAYVTVTNLYPSVRYNIRKGGEIGDLKSSTIVLGSDAQSADAATEEVVFPVKKTDAKFFQVIRQPLNK